MSEIVKQRVLNYLAVFKSNHKIAGFRDLQKFHDLVNYKIGRRHIYL